MEPFTFDSGKLKGVEVLHFDDVEVHKVKGNTPAFASIGPLSVLYFKSLDRFVLKLNDWTYPLMRRSTVTSDGKTFTLPAANGFSYRLVFDNPSYHGFKNFETILSENTSFGGKKLSASPDDRASRKISGHKEVHVAGLVRPVVEKAKEVAQDLTGKKKPLAKKRMMPGSIKNRNYKKSAKTTLRKDFLKTEKKLTRKFLNNRRDNANLKEARELADIKKTTDSLASTMFIRKEEIEDAIARQKGLFKSEATQPEKKGIVESIKQSVHGLKEQVQGLVHRDAPREPAQTQQQGHHSLVEGILHYSG